MHGRSVTIFVPHGNSVEKNAAMRALGAEVVEFGDDFQEARERSIEFASDRGLEPVPPFHQDLVLGVATYAKELFEGAGDLETVYVPVGMGSGINALIAVRDLLGLDTQIVGVVSERAPSTLLSFERGEVVTTESAATFVDGVATRSPDPVSIAGIVAGAARIIAVSDDATAEAMRIIYRSTHNLAESAGAIGFAGLLSETPERRGKRSAFVLCGGNVDSSQFHAVLGGATPRGPETRCDEFRRDPPAPELIAGVARLQTLSVAASSSAAGSRTDPERVASTSRRLVSFRRRCNGRSPCSACDVGSTVHPTPSCTISRSTSGWWLSATTSIGAPSRRNSSTTSARVCEPAGNSTHGPQVVGGPFGWPGGAYTARSSVSRGVVSMPPTGVGGSTHTTRSSSPADEEVEEFGGGRDPQAQVDARGGRCGSVRSWSGRWTTAAASIIPSRSAPLRPVRTRSAQPARSWVSASTWRAWATTGAADGRTSRRRPSRSNSATPTRRSSSARPCDNAEALTPTRSAATAQVGSSATATRYSSCRIDRSGSGCTSARYFSLASQLGIRMNHHLSSMG